MKCKLNNKMQIMSLYWIVSESVFQFVCSRVCETRKILQKI